MSQHDENAHEDIARRLRETGIVSAPDDVRATVMRQIRETRPTPAPSGNARWRRRVWPIAYAAAAAAAIVVGAVIVTSNGGVSSNGGAAAGSAGGGATAGHASKAPSTVGGAAAQLEGLPHSRVYRVPESVARSLLGPSLPQPQERGVTSVPVPAQRFDALKTLLRTAASEPPVNERYLRLRLVRVK